MHTFGKYLIIIGLFVVLAGVVFWLWPSRWNWLGNLPGDIRIEKENFRFYFPLTTSIIISIILSFILYIVRQISRFF